MPPTLVHLPQSPFSEKARWALDHHGVSYRGIVHMPMLYEPLLRIASRQLRKKATVPMLFDSGVVLRDSLEIALYAEQRGRETSPLFPKEHETAIFHWNDQAETLLSSGRARLMHRLRASPAALVEAIPPPLSRLGASLLPVARMGASFVARKYGTDEAPSAASEAAMAGVLELADSALGGGDHLVGGVFTFADIALACAVGMVAPHPRQPLGPASREVWSEPHLAAAFPRVIAWRDRTIEKYR